MVVEAAVVDHIIPRRDRPDLALDPSNLRALCHDCHNRHGQKAGRDDTQTHRGGGFFEK